MNDNFVNLLSLHKHIYVVIRHKFITAHVLWLFFIITALGAINSMPVRKRHDMSENRFHNLVLPLHTPS